jgi:hypothetical protein
MIGELTDHLWQSTLFAAAAGWNGRRSRPGLATQTTAPSVPPEVVEISRPFSGGVVGLLRPILLLPGASGRS